jgi:hypothetical protein
MGRTTADHANTFYAVLSWSGPLVNARPRPGQHQFTLTQAPECVATFMTTTSKVPSAMFEWLVSGPERWVVAVLTHRC